MSEWWKHKAVLCLFSLPVLVLLSPLIRLSFITLGVSMSAAVMVLVVLMLGLLIPQLEALTTLRPGWLPLAALLTTAGLIAIGLFCYHADRLQPRIDFVRYILNADTHRAIWFTTQSSADEWTAQFFPNGIPRGAVGDILPFAQGNWGNAQAPVVALDPPQANLIEDHTANGVRSLRMRITSARHAPLVSVLVDPNY